MSNKKFLFVFFVMLSSLFGIPSAYASMVVNHQATLFDGLQYQVSGTINSITDVSNGNLKANLLVDASLTPEQVKSQLLDGALQISPNSQFVVQSGTPILDNAKSKTFDVNEGESVQPSVLVTQVGKTQTGESFDVLVSLQKVTGTTAGKSELTINGNTSDGSLDIGETALASVQMAFQFQDSTTHQPVKLFMFPVIGDIDGNQQISLNGTVLSHGPNLTETPSGLFASDSTLTNGFSDFPLGGLLYEFYGDTMVSNFNTTSDGSSNVSGVGYGIFGSYGSVKNVPLIYPQSTATLNFFNAFTKQVIQNPQINTGMIYSPYAFSAPLLPGYQFNESLTDKSKLSGTYQTANTNINLYYDKESSVTVNFLDSQTKQPLQSARTLSGFEGQPYTVTASEFPDYRLNTKNSASLTGTYQAENQSINLYYDKKSTVTLKAIGEDSHGNKTPLKTLATLTGYVGDTYSQALPHIQTYKFPSAPATGTFTENDQNIDIIYLKEQGAVSVNYIDQSKQQQLLPTLNISDNIGDKQIIRAPFIPNYTAQNSTGSDALFTQLLPFQTVNVNYLPNQEKITVNFEDIAGHSLRFPLTLAGAYGTSSLYKAPLIKGYDLAPGQVQNINLHFTQPNSALTIRYQHTQGSEHFIFEDENGKQVAQPQTISGDVDSSYNVVAPYVKYLKISNPKQRILSGKYSTQKQTVIVKYTHLKAKLTVYGVDDRGNQVNHQVFTGLEGDTKTVQMPKFRTLQLKNGKYQHFATRLNSQNQTIFVLYKHIKSTLTVNLKVDGVIKSRFSVTGFIGDSFFMKVPASKNSALVGGVSQISGHYNQVHQTYDVNYHYVRSTITFNLYDSAGDYITTRTISGEYGKRFDYTLPAYVWDDYGYHYYPQFNIHQTGYFGAHNESHDVTYQYTGPHGTYVEEAYKVQKNDRQVQAMNATAQGANLQLLAILAPNANGNGEYVPTFVKKTSKAFVINQLGKTYTYTYPTGQWVESDTMPRASTPVPSSGYSSYGPSYPSAPQHQKVYQPAARNFWVRNGTTFLLVGSFKEPPLFSLSMFGGKFYPYHASGINEKQQGLTNQEWKKFLNSAKIWGIYGVMAVQNAGTLATEEIPGVDVVTTSADISADAVELAEVAELNSDNAVLEAESIDISVKPEVSNSKLQNIVQDLYKGQGGEGGSGTIGNGTTMDAVRNERVTGEPTYGKYHTEKLENYQRALEKRLRSGDLDSHDKSVAQALIRDIKDALGK
ncbi:MucBP domain-containing protein [Lactococcus taiwanensis]|uniref:MucBP domain-containing protein n=1 Tax=Lactococcus taiwanensis TaxID=1151742 RepID=UPI0028A93C11|nr:MucBP domain-containing protein [Lactococcus taiwanensis]